MNTTTNTQTANAPGFGINELLACPFCGGPATLVSFNVWPWSDREHYYKCALCKVSPGETYSTPDEAAKIWNVRAG